MTLRRSLVAAARGWAAALCVLGLAQFLLPARVQAADWHVSTAEQLRAALQTAAHNGEDDTIYLAAGTYAQGLEYVASDGKSLVVRGEPGTTAGDVFVHSRTVNSAACDISGRDTPGARVRLQGLTLERSTASGLAIVGRSGGLQVILDGVVLQGNTAQGDGGGISAQQYATGTLRLEIWNSIIRDNLAPGSAGRQGRGAGIYLIASGGAARAELLVVNSLIVNNQGNWPGAGLQLIASDQGAGNSVQATFVNTTISGNASAVFGGSGVDIWSGPGSSGPSLAMYNTILYGNRSADGREAWDLWVESARGTNIAIDAYNCDIGDVWGGSGIYHAYAVISQDPAFADAAHGDYHLSSASPCLDLGTLAVPVPPGLPATDLDGRPRVMGSAPDMGAYERRATWLLFLPVVRR